MKLDRSMMCVALVASAAAVGCNKADTNAAPAASTSASAAAATPTTPAPSASTAAAEPAKRATPNWMKTVPNKPVPAKVGDKVWAIIGSDSSSNSDLGLMSLYKVDAINGNVASVSGKAGKFDVPGAFIIPIGDMTKLKAGDAVVAAQGNGWGPALVTKNDKGAVTARFFLSDKTAKDEPTDAATAIPKGSTTHPFSLVYYEKFPGKNYNGYLVAQDGNKSWVLDHDSVILTVTEAKLHTYAWGPKDRKVGDKVIIFAGMGATPAVVEKVLDPKNYWLIKFESTSMTSAFDNVTDKL